MRILIADDHRLVVEGMKMKLAELGDGVEFTVAATVAELQETLTRGAMFELALIDLAMPGANGRQHLQDVLRRCPHTRVVVVSGAQDPALMKELFELGVQGFIPKAYSADVMLSAVRLVLSGGMYVPPMMLHPDIDSTPPGAVGGDAGDTAAIEARLRNLLTERQLGVLRLLARGKPNKVIARDLGISEGTVKIHLAAIFRALNVRNRVEAVIASQRLGGL